MLSIILITSSSGSAEACFSASDTALLQEVADSKIKVQSACALDTLLFQ
jgi:hypothetical protein